MFLLPLLESVAHFLLSRVGVVAFSSARNRVIGASLIHDTPAGGGGGGVIQQMGSVRLLIQEQSGTTGLGRKFGPGVYGGPRAPRPKASLSPNKLPAASVRALVGAAMVPMWARDP